MIKLFEEYNEYYTEISAVDFYSYDNRLKFTPEEHKILDNIYGEDIEIIGIDASFFMNCRYQGGRYLYCISINKLSDEWYILYCKGTFYKCDQLDGLVKLLNFLKRIYT